MEGNAVDHADDVGNLLAALVDVGHGLDHVMHDGAAMLGYAAGLLCHLCRLLGAVGSVLQGLGQLHHGSCGLLQVAGGDFSAL